MNDITPNKWIKNPANRKYIYGVAAAIGAALVGYQVITQDQLELWLNIAANLLLIGGSTLGFVNTPEKVADSDEGDTLEDIFKPSDEVRG